MKYVKESLGGAVTGVLTLDGGLPDNPPYEYAEITEPEYGELLAEMASRPAEGADAFDYAEYVRGLMEGLDDE